MPKFFVNDNQIERNKVKITGTDVNHIMNVLRFAKGELLTITNKDNQMSYFAKIIDMNKQKIECEIIEQINEKTESNIQVSILQGLPKSDKMEYIIQKSTELGVHDIIPVSLKRCIVKLNGKDEIKKIERWQKIAEVAAKQSGRDIIPQIEQVHSIEEICTEMNKWDLVIIAYENEKENTLKKELKKLKKEQSLKIGVIIGPEGGLEENEVEILKQHGARVITLGSRILRTETASIATLSNIIYEFEM